MKKYTIWHTTICRSCGSDFTKPDSIRVHFVDRHDHHFDSRSHVDRRGLLCDCVSGSIGAGSIAAGCHGGSYCVACENQIEEEMAPPTPKALQALTYRDLLKNLLEAPNCELDQDVTIYFGGIDEFFPVTGLTASFPRGHVCKNEDDCPAAGILDQGHLYLECDMVNAEMRRRSEDRVWQVRYPETTGVASYLNENEADLRVEEARCQAVKERMNRG